MVPSRALTVLDAYGRPAPRAMDPAYRNAGTSRRFLSLQAGVNLGPNAALLPHLETLRVRARLLFRNNPIVRGALKKLVHNLVGWGITPQSLHERKPTRRALAALWTDWAKQVGVDSIQRQAAQEYAVAGEVFLRIRPRRPDDRDALGRKLIVPLELQLIEAEHVPVTEDRPLPNGGYIRAGIEFDPIGRRAAYWVYPTHPGDGGTYRVGDQELRRVPATEMIHLFDQDSPESIRGVPSLATVTLTAERLDAMHDAMLERHAIAAMLAGFIKRPEGATEPGFFGETAAQPVPVWEPGTLSYLGIGEEISFPSLPDVGANYQSFVRAMHLLLSVGLGTTYEMTSNDLSQVNYSSIRAGALEFRLGCQTWQYTVFGPQFLEPIWVQFLRRAQLAGAVDIPGLLDDEVKAGRVEWITQGWDWVDPEKEVNAAIKEVQAGFETRATVNMRRGNDPRVILAARKVEVDEAKELGLQFSTDVPEPVAAPAASAPPAAEEPAAPLRAVGGRRE